MDEISAVLSGLDDADPDDSWPRRIVADRLDDTRLGWGHALRAACNVHLKVPGLPLPDRFMTFHTPSEGWEVVGVQLDDMAAHPENTAAFRSRYERLVRGDVPLDPDRLEQTLRLHYDLQVRLLASLGLLEQSEGEQFIVGIDGGRHMLPDYESVLVRLRTPALQLKIRQGFDTLILVPFCLSLDCFADAWREGLRRNEEALQRIGEFDADSPLWIWNESKSDTLVYHPHELSEEHGGKSKSELLAENAGGWDVLLIEGGQPNLPAPGEGLMIGGRAQPECGRNAREYLEQLLAADEAGFTPEAYIIAFLDALERRAQVLDTESVSLLVGSYLPSSRQVPAAYWLHHLDRACLYAEHAGGRREGQGVRAAVKVL